MNPLIYQLESSQINDLVAVCALGNEKLNQLATTIEKRKFTIIESKLALAIKNQVGQGEGEKLLRVIFGISASLYRNSYKADEAVEGISRAIDGIKEKVPGLANWDDCVAPLLRILNAKSVVSASKARSISYDFENIFSKGHFISSIRPIFDEDRSEILGSSVVQTLTVEYYSSNELKRLSLALDLDDIESLKLECERALRKSSSIKSKIEEQWDIEVLVTGGKSDE